MASDVGMTDVLERDLEVNLWPKKGTMSTFFWREF